MKIIILFSVFLPFIIGERTSLTNPPYVIKTDAGYEGFLPDLLQKMGEKVKADFVLSDQEDGRYGMPVGEEGAYWNGMIGSVVNGDAALAAGDITVTAARERVVDFTVPFMQTGISILYYQPTWKLKTFNSLEDLMDQDDIKFGCVKGGATERFFKNSKVGFYNKVWEKMVDMNEMTSNNEEGIQKVLSGGYAYLIESSSAEFAMTQHCDLVTVGGNINLRNYALALPQGSPYREVGNIALLELMEEGEVSALKDKWWKKNAKNCDQVSALLSSFAEFF